MVVIVGRSLASVEILSSPGLLPSVDSLRPGSCPGCQHPAHPLGERLGIVGHGTYQRQVLGLREDDSVRSLVIWIRRFLCRGCRRTISVLPDVLYPGRWYCGACLLVCLFLHLVKGEPADLIRRVFGGTSQTHRWKTLERWQRQLLDPLWSWLAAQLGFRPAGVRRSMDQRQRLVRLLALHGVGPPGEIGEVERAACALLRDTAHDGRHCWPVGHDRPEDPG